MQSKSYDLCSRQNAFFWHPSVDVAYVYQQAELDSTKSRKLSVNDDILWGSLPRPMSIGEHQFRLGFSRWPNFACLLEQLFLWLEQKKLRIEATIPGGAVIKKEYINQGSGSGFVADTTRLVTFSTSQMRKSGLWTLSYKRLDSCISHLFHWSLVIQWAMSRVIICNDIQSYSFWKISLQNWQSWPFPISSCSSAKFLRSFV